MIVVYDKYNEIAELFDTIKELKEYIYSSVNKINATLDEDDYICGEKTVDSSFPFGEVLKAWSNRTGNYLLH